MKGSKYLSELVDLNMLRKDKLNIIQAPTGSGKTFFALNTIPSLANDPTHHVVFLIDTINGKEQILANYKAKAENWGWACQVMDGDEWFGEDIEKIVVMTYAKFGIILNRYMDFQNQFNYIICDELHNLLRFQYFERRPNNHSVVVDAIHRAVTNDKTTVIALTATPQNVMNEFCDCYIDIPIDNERIKRYETYETISFSDINNLIAKLPPQKTGICYTDRINTMIVLEEKAKRYGLSPVSIWSTANMEHPLCKEQLAARECIVNSFRIPPDYNLLIINDSLGTSIKINSLVDYVIVNNSNPDIQTQVRGRVNNDLALLYLPDKATYDEITVPDEFLGKMLFDNEKKALAKAIDYRKNGKQCEWPTIKKLLPEFDYTVTEGRKENKRYAIINTLKT